MPESKFECALVTGASSGIGRALCQKLAEKGIALIVVARREERLQKLAEELRGKVGVEIVTADLADRDQRKKVLQKIYERVPDLVVNNAGFGYYGAALEHQTEKSLELLEVDAAALLEISLEAARALVTKGKKGVIMNISSVAGFHFIPYLNVYSAAKAFVNSFSEGFDEEMRPYGIRVLASCPGVVHTEFRERASDGKSPGRPPFSMSVQFAANEIWKQIETRKKIRAFDWRYRLGMFLLRYVLPKRVAAYVLGKNREALGSKKEVIPVNFRD